MGTDPFITDFDPPVGRAEELAPGLRRLVAPNASPMTFRGTNTYLLGEAAIAVIDPGPDDPRHLDAILGAVGNAHKISHIFITHSHVDHSPLARRLSALSNAPVLAFGDSTAGRSPRMVRLAALGGLGGGEGVDTAFKPDILLKDEQIVASREWALRALTTPGHFPNHLCFRWEAENAIFSGDHVMSWATTLVSPPDGDLSVFMASLKKMLHRQQDRCYFPGHGAMLAEPQTMLKYQIGHREARESQILSALANGQVTPLDLARRIYTDIPPELIPAAARNVFAHLIDLVDRNLVEVSPPLSSQSRFSRCC